MEKRARVLVVDDDPVYLRGLQQMFATDRFDVVSAGDGKQALALALGQSFDLIISDHRMPRVSGLELLTRLRKAGKSVPFILVTAYDLRDIGEAARALGAAAVLEKPVEFRALIDRCEEVLRNHAGNRAQLGQSSSGAEL